VIAAEEMWPVMLATLIITFVSIFLLRPLAIRINLVDVPTERKLHEDHIPLTGGLAIFSGLLFATLLISLFFPSTPTNEKLVFLLATSAIILVIGLVDDYKDLGPLIRFLVQTLACLIMMVSTGIYVESLGNLIGTGEIHLGLWGIPFTVLAVVGFINAVNMMDGIDGLAGGISLLAILAILGFQGVSGSFKHVDMLVILAAVLIPYMMSNLGMFGLPRIFLGDAGSMLIGYLIAWTLIILSQSPQGEDVAISPVNTLWCVAVPLLDMWAVMFKRLRQRISPFTADRGHLHHLFISHGISDYRVLLIILLGAILLMGIGVVTHYLMPTAGFVVFLFVLVVYVTVNMLLERKLSMN